MNKLTEIALATFGILFWITVLAVSFLKSFAITAAALIFIYAWITQ